VEKLERKKVACIAHFIEAQDITHWDPTLGALCASQAESLLEKACSVIEPFATQNQILINPEERVRKLSYRYLEYHFLPMGLSIRSKQKRHRK